MQVNGAVTSGPDLSMVVNGLQFPNPFVIGSGRWSSSVCARHDSCLEHILPRIILVDMLVTHSPGHCSGACLRCIWWDAGPPGTNYQVMKRAFEEGWGGVIAKTVSLDSSKVSTAHRGALTNCRLW